MPDWDETTNIISDAAISLDLESGAESRRMYLIVQVGSNVGELFPLTGKTVVIGRSRQADIQLIDDGVSRQHVRVTIERHDDGADVYAEDLDSRNGSSLGNTPLEPGKRCKLENGDRIGLAQGKVMLRFTCGDGLDEKFQRQMFDSSLRDGLTGAFNKRYFSERLESEYRFAERHSEPLSLLMLDLDHFKAINDEHGHLAGDHVLKVFSEAMMKTVRNEDVFARCGGEEFAVISRAIGMLNARRFSERLRKRTESLDIEWEGKQILLTVSIGVATIPDAAVTNHNELLAVTDKALYRAKTAGRNLTSVYMPESEEDTRPV